MVIQAFNYEIPEFSFMGEEINVNYIKFIEIDCMYEEKTMAAMYLSLQVPLEIYQRLIDAEKTEDGFINITIRARNAYSDTSVAEDYISGRFVYVLPSSNPDYSASLSDDIDKSYKAVALSLLQKDYLDKLKTSISGTYYNIDIQDLLRMAFKDMKNVIVQAPTVEGLKKFQKVVIPPMNNMTKMVDYLFNLKPFYSTAYTFFADFNNIFLTAHDQDTSAAIGAVSKVVFHICSATDDAAYFEGVIPGNNTGKTAYIDGDTYHVYLNPADINLSPNKGLDMISNQIMTVEEDGNLSEPLALDFGVLGTTYSEYAKLAMRRGSNLDVIANILNSDTVSLELKKSYINGSIISPDKAVSVQFELSDGKEDFNNKYSGDYYISYKKEIIVNNTGVFAVSCVVGLKKIGNLRAASDMTSESGYLTADGRGGSQSVVLGTRSSQKEKSASIASFTQSRLSRVSVIKSTLTMAPNPNVRNPYNLKSNKYEGPAYIDTKSSGAVNLLEPHITEPKF